MELPSALLLLLLLLLWLAAALSRLLLFGACLFHGFAGLFRALGTRFGTLLALGIDGFFAAEQFNESLLAAIAFAQAAEHDASVTTVAIAESTILTRTPSTRSNTPRSSG